MRRRSLMLALVVAAAPLWTACTVGANYSRPPLPSPPQYRFVNGGEAETLADVPWFEIFQDPTLQALIRESLANNLDLRAAAARVEEARARAGIVKSFLYPQVGGSAQTTVGQASTALNGEDDDDNTRANGVFGFQLSWELDLFGRIRREHEAALAFVLASEQGRRGILVTLIGDVASNYFLLRELDLQLEIGRRTLRSNDETVLYFQNRLDGGVSNRLELDRIRALRSETAVAIPEIEQQIAIVEHAISLLVGRPPGRVDRSALGPDEILPPPIPPGLPASLLERRPDVLQAEQLLVAANADIGVAKARFFPTISLTGFLGGVSGDLASLMGQGGLWSSTLGLFQPIYQGGRLRRDLEAAQARFDVALAGYQKAALNGYREVANALISIQKLGEIRVERQAAVDVLRDAGDLARSRYESGLATYLEILDADQQLFQQELLLAQAQGAELQARTDLYRALGGGWQP